MKKTLLYGISITLWIPPGLESRREEFVEKTRKSSLRVQKLFSKKFESDFEIVFDDSSDFHNGMATAIPRHKIIVNVQEPDKDSSLYGGGDSIEQTLVHEMAHMLSFAQRRGAFSVLYPVFGSTMTPNGLWPRWVHEGLAVWAEVHATPNDLSGRWKNQAIQKSMLKILDREYQNWELDGSQDWEGEIPYHYGFLILSRYVERYGAEKFWKTFFEESAKWSGLAFEQVLTKHFEDPKIIWKEIQSEIRSSMGGRASISPTQFRTQALKIRGPWKGADECFIYYEREKVWPKIKNSQEEWQWNFSQGFQPWKCLSLTNQRWAFLATQGDQLHFAIYNKESNHWVEDREATPEDLELFEASQKNKVLELADQDFLVAAEEFPPLPKVSLKPLEESQLHFQPEEVQIVEKASTWKHSHPQFWIPQARVFSSGNMALGPWFWGESPFKEFQYEVSLWYLTKQAQLRPYLSLKYEDLLFQGQPNWNQSDWSSKLRWSQSGEGLLNYDWKPFFGFQQYWKAQKVIPEVGLRFRRLPFRWVNQAPVSSFFGKLSVPWGTSLLLQQENLWSSKKWGFYWKLLGYAQSVSSNPYESFTIRSSQQSFFDLKEEDVLTISGYQVTSSPKKVLYHSSGGADYGLWSGIKSMDWGRMRLEAWDLGLRYQSFAWDAFGLGRNFFSLGVESRLWGRTFHYLPWSLNLTLSRGLSRDPELRSQWQVLLDFRPTLDL